MDYYVRYKFSFRERCFAFLGFIPIQVAKENIQTLSMPKISKKDALVTPATEEIKVETPLHFHDKNDDITTNL
jgi:hypothetical protein